MLKLNHLSKTFYQKNCDKLVVDDLSLEVKKGTVVGFLGVNGAGKTTTIKMIVGLTKPDSGEVIISGKSFLDPEARRSVGFMPETPQFYRHLNVAEILNYVAELFGLNLNDFSKTSKSLLKQVGLSGNEKLSAKQLSKGMTQRLAFAVALVNNPELLILDEPLDGLDPVGRLDIKELIMSLKKKGKTVFLSSHILADAEEICDEIFILHDGKIIAHGTPKQLIGHTNKTLEQVFVEIVKNNKNVKK